VRETVATARERDKPYAVVLNAAPSKRDAREMAVVAQSRAFLDKHQIPVWSGQISQRAGLALTLAAGKSACEIEPGPPPPPRSLGCGRRSALGRGFPTRPMPARARRAGRAA
jgi:hypothetical protein